MAYGPVCDTPVERAAMVHWWDDLTFLHWRFEPDAVQRLLPRRARRSRRWTARAWVGLVPFFLRVGLPGVPSVPWLSRFAETNVRTYVRSARRRARHLVLLARRRAPRRRAHGPGDLPASRTSGRGCRSSAAASTIAYRCRRRWPGPRGARSDVVIDIGDAVPAGRAHRARPLPHRALVALQRAAVRAAPRARLPRPVAAAPRRRAARRRRARPAPPGFPQPIGEPLVHYSPSVEVRIGWPFDVGP